MKDFNTILIQKQQAREAIAVQKAAQLSLNYGNVMVARKVSPQGLTFSIVQRRQYAK